MKTFSQVLSPDQGVPYRVWHIPGIVFPCGTSLGHLDAFQPLPCDDPSLLYTFSLPKVLCSKCSHFFRNRHWLGQAMHTLIPKLSHFFVFPLSSHTLTICQSLLAHLISPVICPPRRKSIQPQLRCHPWRLMCKGPGHRWSSLEITAGLRTTTAQWLQGWESLGSSWRNCKARSHKQESSWGRTLEIIGGTRLKSGGRNQGQSQAGVRDQRSRDKAKSGIAAGQSLCGFPDNCLEQTSG